MVGTHASIIDGWVVVSDGVFLYLFYLRSVLVCLGWHI